VTSTVNPNGATGVAVNNRIAATFSEAMDPTTISGTTFTFKQGTTTVPGTFSYTGVTGVFTPSSPLAFNTTYTGTITTGARDLAGNALSGNQGVFPAPSNYVWSWTTGAAPDTTPPTVIATINANGATNVPVNTRMGATFSEAMDPHTITTATFSFRQGTTPVPGTVTYSGVTAVFTPTNPLSYNTTYTGTITSGGATDLAGNALSGNQGVYPAPSNYVWSWTTGAEPYVDNTRPTVISTIPANGATGVFTNTKVSATFSEAMYPLSITNLSFTLRHGTTADPGTVDYAGITAVFTPASPLLNNTIYTATITTAVVDLAGNSLAANYVWNFTTAAAADTTAPTVTLTAPVNLASNVALNSTVKATFSESMDPLTIPANFTLYNGLILVPGLVIYDVPTRIATFTPTNPLLTNTTYTAKVSNAAKDLAGNALVVPAVGLPQNPWTFSTAGVVPPPTLNLLSFGIASAGGITNSGATKINGNAVLDPTATCNAVATDNAGGFGLCGGLAPTKNSVDQVITPLYPDTTTAHAIMAELRAKWLSIKPSGLPGATTLGCGTIGSAGDAGALLGCSGNSVIPPGVYISATGTTIGITGDLTLNGSPTDTWVFQAPSAITTAVNSRIILTGGAKASNIWWYVGSSATLGGGSIFNGSIAASASITMGTGATSCGRLLAGAEGAGAFSFLSNTVSVPGHANAPAGCL
jgi:hypothetical protein